MSGKRRKKLTADDVEQRIARVRAELEGLIYEIDQQVRAGDVDIRAPDTERLFEVRYAAGQAMGLHVALSALEVERVDIERALEPAEVQRRRQEELAAETTPAAREFVAALKEGPGAPGGR